MTFLEDHGLPLVGLKEQRRQLVVALVGSKSMSPHQIAEIASIQHSIAAIEAVVGDLVAGVARVPTAPALRLVHSTPARTVLQRSFGRRRA
jgi:hypothetical protein